jgi:hypothetical protein
VEAQAERMQVLEGLQRDGRAAPWVALANTSSRSSVNSDVDSRSRP